MRKKVMFLLFIRKSKLPIIILTISTVFLALILVDYHWKASSGKIKRKIVVDPGHGGIDGGANDGKEFLEKDINLKIATYLKEELEKAGSKTILTRESDSQLDHLNQGSSSRHKRDLLARVQIINDNEPDVFVSIHVNANVRKPETKGPMVFYYKESEEGKTLGSSVLNKLNEYTKNYNILGEKEPIGTKRYFILRNSKIPGILVEVGFMTNPQEKKLLTSDEYQKGIAHAIFLGVKDYFDL